MYRVAVHARTHIYIFHVMRVYWWVYTNVMPVFELFIHSMYCRSKRKKFCAHWQRERVSEPETHSYPTHAERKMWLRQEEGRQIALVILLPFSYFCPLLVVYLSPFLIYIFWQIFTVYSMFSHRELRKWMCVCVCENVVCTTSMASFVLLRYRLKLKMAMSQHEWYLRISVKVFRIDFDFCEKTFSGRNCTKLAWSRFVAKTKTLRDPPSELSVYFSEL